jgi:hypothetical protein
MNTSSSNKSNNLRRFGLKGQHAIAQGAALGFGGTQNAEALSGRNIRDAANCVALAGLHSQNNLRFPGLRPGLSYRALSGHSLRSLVANIAVAAQPRTTNHYRATAKIAGVFGSDRR